MAKKNPLIPFYSKNNISDFLEVGEVIIPINPYAKEGYIFQPYYYVTNFAKIFSFLYGQWYQRSDFENENGYRKIKLQTIDGKSVEIMVHRLVLASFFPFDGMYDYDVDHKDSVRSNDCLYNLQWLSHKENVQESYNRGMAESLGDDKIIEIYNKITAAFPNNIDNDLGKEYNVSPNTIRSIRLGVAPYKATLDRHGLKPIVYKRYKTSDEEIIEMFKLFSEAYPKNIDNEMAEKYNISVNAIINIRTGSGKYLERLNKLGLKPITYPRANNKEDIIKIMTMANSGVSDAEIARVLNKNRDTIINIRTGSGYYGSILEELGFKPILKRAASIITNDVINTIMTRAEEVYPNNIDDQLSRELHIPVPTIIAVRSGSHMYGDKLRDLGFEPIIYKSTVEITDDMIRQIFKMIHEGYSDRKIAAKLNISYLTVRNIRVGNGSYGNKLASLNIQPVFYR